MFIDVVMPDRTVMDVQYSNSVTVWQRALKPVVNTFINVHGNGVNNDVLEVDRKLFSS